MTKQDVLSQLQTDLSNPGAEKSGEYLAELVFGRLSRLSRLDRQGVIEALAEWLRLRREPETMLAAEMACRLGFSVLVPEIQRLKLEIENGRVFLPFYAELIDRALAQMK